MQVSVFTKENFLKFMEKQLENVSTVALTDVFSKFEATKKAGITATACFSDFIFNGNPDVRNLAQKKVVCLILDPNLSKETIGDMSETGTVCYNF